MSEVCPSSDRTSEDATEQGNRCLHDNGRWTPVAGAGPPTDVVMPPLPEMARLFAAHGAEILGPPPSLAELS